MDIKDYTKDNGKNFLRLSKIPEECKEKPCILGIDEAGRGPVLGPMVYGIAFCAAERNAELKALGVDDSKALTEAKREELLEKLLGVDYVGWAIHILSPRFISMSMYRRCKYNLNTISHDTAIGLVKEALKAGVRVSEVYVDTVGPPEKYQAKLEEIFPDLKITVAKKADSLYPCVSAASICAKVARDHAINGWKFVEGKYFSDKWGSGYPGDPVTKKFLRDNIDPIFGFPSIVRFSWKTAESLLEEKGCHIEFEEVEPEEDPAVKKNPSVKQFFVQASKPGRSGKANKRCNFFSDRKLVRATAKTFLSE